MSTEVKRHLSLSSLYNGISGNLAVSYSKACTIKLSTNVLPTPLSPPPLQLILANSISAATDALINQDELHKESSFLYQVIKIKQRRVFCKDSLSLQTLCVTYTKHSTHHGY